MQPPVEGGERLTMVAGGAEECRDANTLVGEQPLTDRLGGNVRP